MKKWIVCYLISMLAWLALAQRPAKPNFMILLGDDLGWQDVGCYDVDSNAVYETPYMDQLATEGIRFMQGYSPAPVCAPSRYGILSGRFPARGKTSVQGGECPKPYRQSFRMMDPYYTGRMKLDEITIAEALKPYGYLSGHSGKWHVAVNHNAFPQPGDQGFDFTKHDLGISRKMADRLSGFATTNAADAYQLRDLNGLASTNGYAFDQTTQDIIDFMGAAVSSNVPFFGYYAAWYVHAPIQTRTERLLEKYALKMGYSYPLDGTEDLSADAQINPYYGAMVEEFDFNVQRIIKYLKETDDPRWPGHKLMDNTYIFLTSDNGGMEGTATETYTDNDPLDRGKIRAEEGGTRVPFIVVGPDVPTNEVSDVMVNGLDIYPTMLSLAGIPVPERLDGCDLGDLLTVDPQAGDLVKHFDGSIRDTMYWHFPHGSALHSTIRKDGWKLFRNFDWLDNSSLEPYRLYRLYNTNGSNSDIEEAIDLVDVETAKVSQLSAELNTWMTQVNARLPYYNPTTTSTLTNKGLVPTVLDSGNSNGTAWVAFQENGAAVVHADLIYTLNGDGGVNEEWFRMDATLDEPNGRAEAEIPVGTTHYVFNLIDENNFLVSSVDVGILSDHIPDSQMVPAYEPVTGFSGQAGFTNIGTAYPTNDVLMGSSISAVNGVPVRDNNSYTTAGGQTFTLTNSATLTALTLKGGNSASFGSGDHKVALWIGGYNNGTPGDTLVYETIDLANTSFSSGSYYTIDFTDTVFPAGRYSFQLGWTTNDPSHDIRFFRADGTGVLDGEGRLYGANKTTLPFNDSSIDDDKDLVYALHGSEIVPEPGIVGNNLNYTYLYFENGLPTPMKHRRPQSEAYTAARANPDLVVQTGYYSLVLDCDDMDFKGYDALAGSDYRTALTNDVSVFTLADLILSVVKDGTNFTCTSASVQNSTNQLVRLIQSNRFNQRFDHLGLVFEDGEGNVLDANVRFELTAWPDRVALKLDATGVPGVTETSVSVVSPALVLHESTVAGNSAVLCIQPHTDTTVPAWNPGDYILDAYNRDTLAALATTFDTDEYALHIDVPAASVSYPADTNRVDEYVVEVTNPDSVAKNIPLIFEQPTPRKITGTVMTLCEDGDGRPTGIPVQVSKDWHKDAANPTPHQGSWLRGYTMLNLAAGETKRFRLRVIYGYWAGAGAISHSQLSLIGWGKNWKWDESALGAWGESCTYDPCLHAGAAFMDDIRPTFTTPMNGGTDHNWTENSGGGDFLIYRDSSNTYHWIKRLKTAYLWTGPNMTEVLYSGITDDDKIRVTYSSRAVRTSDYHRRFHGYRYEFLDDVVSPERLVFHQMAADYYTGPTFTNYYRGDGTGLLASTVADPGGNTYKGTPVQFNNQWLSIDDGMSYDKVSRSRRGLLNLSSTLNGSAFPLYMHTYGRSWGSDRMMFDFSADTVGRSYSAGDVVEGEFEFIMPPNDASVYWGNDAEFAGRLAAYGSNPWNAVYDEFRHNVELDLAVHEGTLLRNYPLEIDSAAGDVLADFTIYSGGIGHVPVVLYGVATNLALQAQRWAGGGWVPLETADVTENDDYQGMQNPDGTMDVVFNITRPSSDLAESWRIRIVSGSATDLQGNYGDWIHGYGLNGTNLANTANPDLDSGNNLYEYALGGDPTNPADIGWLPTGATLEEGGTNWFEFIHARRKNSEGELSYILESTANLLSNDWNTATYAELPTTGNLDADYELVTNRIDTTGKTREFIRLKVDAL